MNTPYGDDGVDDSAFNRCEHGVLLTMACIHCEAEGDDFDEDFDDDFVDEPEFD